jgi:large subunit ribosomal protein L17
MTGYRKLGRPTDQRIAILKNLVTALIEHGKVETTEARAKEVKSIADKLISLAVKEADNFTSKQVKVSGPKLDSKGRKVTKSVTSKNGNKYEVVEREDKTEMVTVDSPSRLQARKQAIKWLRRSKDTSGNNKNVANILFNDIAPKYKGRPGGFTRMYKLGQRRGDGAEVVLLQLVED